MIRWNRMRPVLSVMAALAAFTAADSGIAQNAIPSRTARIEIRDQVEISVDLPGTLTYVVAAAPGAEIEADTEVVRLDDTVIRAQYEEAKKKAESDVLIRYAEIKRDTAEASWQDKQTRQARAEAAGTTAFNEEEMRLAELEYEQGKAEVIKATEDQILATLALATKGAELKQYSRRAPIGGTVTKVDRHVGEAVRQGDPIITITNLSRVTAVISVSPEYADQLQIGARVLVTRRVGGGRADAAAGARAYLAVPDSAEQQAPEVPAGPAEVFQGEVTFVPAEITGSEQLIDVHASVENRRGANGLYLLRQGTQVDAKILID